jgi:hypothetical protein
MLLGCNIPDLPKLPPVMRSPYHRKAFLLVVLQTQFQFLLMDAAALFLLVERLHIFPMLPYFFPSEKPSEKGDFRVHR